MTTETPNTAQPNPNVAANTTARDAKLAQGGTGLRSIGRRDWATWPKYEAGVFGFRNYWYPVTWSKHVNERKPLAVNLAGEKVMLIREKGVIRALHDRCPHRGVPLS